MNAALPAPLAAALDALLDGASRRDLASRAARLSAAYRGGGTSAAIADDADALAYAVARMPATYAAVRAVLARVAEAALDFAPSSLLDVGAGPGTASWAALDAWPGIARITMLERNAAFRMLASKLAGDFSDIEILAGDIGGAMPKADLVVASYVLAELPEERAAAVAAHLWQGARMLVLVEPGTPTGFARIRAARAALIAAGAHVAAPCTHDNACPLSDGDWCHFSQRLPRSRDHMRAKDAHVPFEDERYSYLAVSRAPVAKGARILSPPLEEKPGLAFKLCDSSGLSARFVPRRDKESYRQARRLDWGDLMHGPI